MPMSVMARAKRLVPSSVRAPLSQLLSTPRAYLLARRVSQGYARHYHDAQRQYIADGSLPDVERPSLSAIGVRTLRAGDAANLITLPHNHCQLVDRVERDVSERLSMSANCLFHPSPSRLTERSDDLDEMRRHDILTATLKKCLDLDGLEELCAGVLPEVERAIYGAYVLVDKVYVLRTFVSRHRERSSWVWHYDEHPLETLKLMIYLTDVDEHTAPFTYLAAPDSHAAVMATKTPLYGQSRIPASTMERHFRKGYRAQSVTGPRGTAILFNDNVIHRATFAERSHRDVLTLQLRPFTRHLRPYVDPRWTGSVDHRDFNRDPTQIEPQTLTGARI
jgi:hypothetical protein